ncbi:MAG: hypothetical protein RSE97_07935 [Oscillospiraceae bacterium]
MKKKSFLAIVLALSMMLAMATPAFAANTNTDGTEVTKPGHPEYTVDNVQTAGESYNKAEITKGPNDANWATVNDDDKLAGAADTNGADINVWAKVTDSGSKIYKVDLTWGAMKFEYDSGSGKWNPTTHKYDSSGTSAWTATYLDGANNKVTVTNHSNNGIDATFAYAMNGTKFNEANGADNVIGNFFDTNDKSKTAAAVLTGTYTGTSGTVNDAAVTGKLTGSKIALATAAAYNSTPGDAAATDGANNQIAGARTDDVFFAFSGTPDAGKGAALDTFKKVGVITITVTPNDAVPLNRPSFK